MRCFGPALQSYLELSISNKQLAALSCDADINCCAWCRSALGSSESSWCWCCVRCVLTFLGLSDRRSAICKSKQHLTYTGGLAVCRVVYHSICMLSCPCVYENTSFKAGCRFKAHVLLISLLLPRGQCSVYLQAMIIDFKLPWPSPTAGMVHTTASSHLPNPFQKATSFVCPLSGRHPLLEHSVITCSTRFPSWHAASVGWLGGFVTSLHECCLSVLKICLCL